MAIQRLSDFFGVSDSALAQQGVINAAISVDNRFFIEPRLLFHTKNSFFR
ncbi:hypothetical protein EDE15_3569 [Edaphobacter aggregans]|uniref:Uncharacterized protein n=1 Tax=Edaphobacter aggregans TaxID=570835 RepID=A0A3R9PBI3_9BACT|nr:hypothetical protein EDE15_3569 [Edaphobacter aggregans]